MSFRSIDPLIGDDVVIWESFFTHDESHHLFGSLRANIEWQQDEIEHFGKRIPLPRLTAWYGDQDARYTYSNIANNPKPWAALLLEIKTRVEQATSSRFNSVLLNLYRSGRDGVGWHQDNEPELGTNPVIASVSFGDTRTFQLRHRRNRRASRIDIPLNSGSVLLMRGRSQVDWLHQVPRTARPVGERINLTFRLIHPTARRSSAERFID